MLLDHDPDSLLSEKWERECLGSIGSSVPSSEMMPFVS